MQNMSVYDKKIHQQYTYKFTISSLYESSSEIAYVDSSKASAITIKVGCQLKESTEPKCTHS